MTSTDSSDPKAPPQTPVLTVACRMLRSPSHESVTTDLSLFSVSSIASEAAGGGTRAMRLVTFKSYSDAQLAARGPSPNPDSRALQSARNLLMLICDSPKDILGRSLRMSPRSEFLKRC
ncbi:hypothetical protein L9F63_008778, partial [Diploptera punctata]